MLKLSKILKKPSDKLLRLLFPPKCIVCNTILSYYAKFPYCNECHLILKSAKISAKSEINLPYIDEVYVLYSYDSEYVKSSVFHAKRIFSHSFAIFFANECAELFEKSNFISKIDFITFATRRKSEKRTEGFDQAEEMAKTISEITGIQYQKTLLRTRKTKKQRTLSSNERKENVSGAFRCTTNLDGKNVLLVDDVLTTGSTLSECSKVLKGAGAEKVFVLAFAC